MPDSQVTIEGSLGQDPTLRFTTSGNAVVSFSVAISHRYNQNGEWKEEPTTWMRVTAWGKTAENVAYSCSKGTRVIVVGRLKNEDYEDKDSGRTIKTTGLIADDIGVSLKWDRAEPVKTEREGGGRGSGTTQRASKERKQDAAYDSLSEEEPF